MFWTHLYWSLWEGGYELGDLKYIPLDVICVYMMSVHICMGLELVMWRKRELYINSKIYVMRSEGEYEDEFTLKFTIDKKSYTLFQGVMRTRKGVDALEFIPEQYASVVVYQW